MKFGSRMLKVASIIGVANPVAGNERYPVLSQARPFACKRAAFLLGFFRLALAAALEHLEHAVGDEEATDDVDRPECDRDRAGHLHERVGSLLPNDEQAAEEHDPVNRVRAGHQRRVQHRRDLRDHLEPEEDREHEHRQLGDEGRGVAHTATSASRLVTQAPATISSSQSSTNSPSRTNSPTSDATLRESSWLACVGIVEGRFVVPTIVTSDSTTSSPGTVSSQLPPVSAARSTITDPERIAR